MRYLRGVCRLLRALLARDLSNKENQYRLALEHLLKAEDKRLSVIGDGIAVVSVKAAKRRTKRRLAPELSELIFGRLTAVQRERERQEPEKFTLSRDFQEINFALYFTCPREQFRIKRD